MTHGGFKDISRRNPKYDEYQRVLASVCYTFSEKKKKKRLLQWRWKTKMCQTIVHAVRALAEELHKPIIKKCIFIFYR